MRDAGKTSSNWDTTGDAAAAGAGEWDVSELDLFPPVLDPCCGSRMMWFDKSDPRALFGDKRTEAHVLCDGRSLEVRPDLQADFRALPFPDGTFHHVVFDPPHFENLGPESWMVKKYGKLGRDWRDELRDGFTECFRVLRPHGTLIFKWNETRITVREVLELTPHKPLYGHKSGKQQRTHWMAFLKNGDAA